MSISYYFYRIGGAVAPKIPPSVGYLICNLLGRIFYRFNWPVRINVKLNLRRVLGVEKSEGEIERLAQATFRYITYNYFDLFRLPKMDDETINRLVTVDGWENVETATAGGKGVVLVSAHLGNIEIALYAILLRGLKITIPAERIEPPELFEYISALRMSRGLELIPIDGSLLKLFRTLKKGDVVGLAVDRDITNSGQSINFFGHPAKLPDGAVRLALKMNVPLVFIVSHRNDDYSYHIFCLPPFYLPTEGTEEERVTVGMNFIVTEMEKAIYKNPEQWTVTVSIWADNQL